MHFKCKKMKSADQLLRRSHEIGSCQRTNERTHASLGKGKEAAFVRFTFLKGQKIIRVLSKANYSWMIRIAKIDYFCFTNLIIY